MREIKLRAWDKISKMYYSGDYDFHFTKSWYVQEKEKPWEMNVLVSSTTGTLMQYTGLKDKNGKEIYEGDIINQFGSMCGEVFYDDERAIYSIRERPSCPQSDLCFGKHQEEDIEVIGNIYENPELLK